jgi:hypothetical protein
VTASRSVPLAVLALLGAVTLAGALLAWRQRQTA